MAIHFACKACKKKFKAADKFAGKSVPCPNCKVPVVIPGLAVPSGSERNGSTPRLVLSAEDIAAKALANEEQPQAPAGPATIEFPCPFCDEKQSFAPAMGGKRAPCTSCRRIIKIPLHENKTGPEWKQQQTNRPAGAVLPKVLQLEGAWDSSLERVSEEALLESGAIVEDYEPLTLGQKLSRAAFVLIFLALGGLTTLFFLSKREQAFDDSKVALIEGKISKDSYKELSPAGKAFLASDISRCKVRNTADPSAAKSRRLLLGSLQGMKEKPQAQSVVDRDFAYLAICHAALALGGAEPQAREGVRLKWDDVQKILRQAVDEISLFEIRVLAVRDISRGLVQGGQSERVFSLVSQIQSGLPDGRDKKMDETAELFAIAGLELFQAKQADQAKQVLDTVLSRYKTAPEKLPSVATVLLAMVLAREKDLPKFQPKAGDEMENFVMNLCVFLQGGKVEDGLQAKALPRDPPGLFTCLARAGFYSTLLRKESPALNQKIAEILAEKNVFAGEEPMRWALLLSALSSELKLPP